VAGVFDFVSFQLELCGEKLTRILAGVCCRTGVKIFFKSFSVHHQTFTVFSGTEGETDFCS
jgi:hypothetical protein